MMNLFPDNLDDGTEIEVLIEPRGIVIYKDYVGGEEIPMSRLSDQERIRLLAEARSIKGGWDDDD